MTGDDLISRDQGTGTYVLSPEITKTVLEIKYTCSAYTQGLDYPRKEEDDRLRKTQEAYWKFLNKNKRK